MLTERSAGWIEMNSSLYRLLYGAGVLLAMFLTWAQLAAAAQGINTRDMPILQDWQGDFPVTELGLLPEGQRELPIGYLKNRKVFTEVWQAFKPEEEIPEIDFGNDMVLFVRNVNFYNRVSIAKVVIRDTTAEVLIRETMSALPIEDKVAMALAVIPRNGVEFLQSGRGPIAVSAVTSDPAANYLDITFEIAGQKIALHKGHSEIALSPDRASKIRTSVFNDPVIADLDSDGDDDAVFFLAHDPGGSGTFYYLAVALNLNGSYPGTNTVLLGDRIIPQSITVQNGIITAAYKARNQGEAMSAVPSITVKTYLTLKSGELTALKPLGPDEQTVAGWVTIGHEIRSFKPCFQKSELWIAGESPALSEIMSNYLLALPHAKTYTPLFMVLVGKLVGPPENGFGADFPSAFFATQFAGVHHQGNCRSDFIVVDSPLPGDRISSPLMIYGRARGSWFFEGDFPIVLKDRNDAVVAEGFVKATSPWMTDEFVPFEGKLEFGKPETTMGGTLVLKKDNPTDNPEHDDEITIPVFLK